MKRLLAIALCLCSLAAAAQTPATGRDYSDLWFTSTESGWGMNVMHQDRILFITLFVYGTDRRPTWYVGSNVAYTSTNAQGDETFTGDLYATTGSPFNAAAFDPATVTATRVGSITFVGRAGGSSSVSYTVNDATVTNASVAKSLVRQTWSNNVVAATRYKGFLNYTNTACTPASDNGVTNQVIDIVMTIASGTFNLVFTEPQQETCTFAGNYAQAGSMGSSAGKITCGGPSSGAGSADYSLTDIQVTSQGFGAKFTATGNCQTSGRIGGTRY